MSRDASNIRPKDIEERKRVSEKEMDNVFFLVYFDFFKFFSLDFPNFKIFLKFCNLAKFCDEDF